jgi:3-dehydroquinate dehydratase II
VKILIINGPNLNLLGKREQLVYGTESFEAILQRLRDSAPDYQIDFFQSNIEGELIDCLQKADGNFKGILLNAGGYSHTSVALADAIAAIQTPVVEIHLSNIFAREDYRHVSIIGKQCRGSISGFGAESYSLGLQYLMRM